MIVLIKQTAQRREISFEFDIETDHGTNFQTHFHSPNRLVLLFIAMRALKLQACYVHRSLSSPMLFHMSCLSIILFHLGA